MKHRFLLFVTAILVAAMSCSKLAIADEISGKPFAQVSGSVTCNGKPVAQVVVSDGIDVVRTDAKGRFTLNTQKEHGYVFISIPSGYKVPAEGILPQFFQYLKQPAGTDEQLQFTLEKDNGQKSHTMLIFGDIHLANRTNDRAQFEIFTSEIAAYRNEHPKDKIYALTLGDMTWDVYWYANHYGFSEYVKDMSAIGDIQVFHTMGNHDHDMAFPGDWQTADKFKEALCPSYYSFNIGNVHYIVLDNIECTNTDGGKSQDRHYNTKMTEYQMDWLRKDLAFVPSDSPVVVTMHATLHKEMGGYSLSNGQLLDKCFENHPNTQFFTGHSHKLWNNGNEHNSGAVCASWWWCGYYTPGLNIAQDGAPGGYKILSVNGNELKSRFRATGRPVQEVFRSYDRNEIEITAEKYAPAANENSATKLANVVGEFGKKDNGNYVLINVWDWDNDWTISVNENGIPLEVERIREFDPLYMIAYTAQRCNRNASLSFSPYKTYHMFRVKASSPSSTLTIKVTDGDGITHIENMQRPKALTLQNYL